MTPQFLFDFGSPNAYLAHKALPDIEARTGVRFAYVPVLLGGVFKATGNQPPMRAFAEVKGKLAYERLEMTRFIARHGLTAFTFNPHFPVNSLAIMRAAVAAETLGLAGAYDAVVFAAMWERGLKMDDAEVIAATLAEAGLPAERLMALAQAPETKERLAANTAAAVDRGVFGSPSVFVGDELYFGKDRLADVEAAIRAAAERESS